MILNRDEFTRLEQEKHTAVTDLTRMLDERHAKYVAGEYPIATHVHLALITVHYVSISCDQCSFSLRRV